MGIGCSKLPDPPLKGDVDLSHFKIGRAVGKGAFGKVCVIKKRDTGQLYVVKYMSKDKIVQQTAVDHVIRERNLLESLGTYPFLVNLRFAFQDDTNLYMVIDLMLGGDLRFHLERCHDTPEHVVQFWLAEIVLGVSYLHRKGVIHRDLKPNNLLFDKYGHLHITDLNVTVHIPPLGQCLKSMCGTVSYMAPEMLCKLGYREEVDWWSVGVILYECLFGKRPFRGKTREDLCRAIIRGKVPISRVRYSLECLSILKGFLEVNPKKRLGHGPTGFKDIINHPFFRGLDWEKLESMELRPPYKPDERKVNFSVSYELEELFMTPKEEKIKYRKRSMMNFEDLTAPFLKMETEYHDFNTMSPLSPPVSDSPESRTTRPARLVSAFDMSPTLITDDLRAIYAIDDDEPVEEGHIGSGIGETSLTNTMKIPCTSVFHQEGESVERSSLI